MSTRSKIEEDFRGLPADLLDALDASIRAEIDSRALKAPADIFPWHRIQAWVLDSPNLVDGPVRIINLVGGNRSGKTKTLMGIWSQMIRHTSPLSRQLLATDRYTGEIRQKGPEDPLTMWVVPPTLEKARQDWINPSDRMGLKYWAGDLFVKKEQSPDLMILTKTPGLEYVDRSGTMDQSALTKTIMKSQDQDLYTFESSEVDAVIVDEEFQDKDKFTSCLMRVATTNGIIIMGFTPLLGLTWTYDRWWKPLVKQGRAECLEDRCYIYQPPSGKGSVVVLAQMGSADNPRAQAYSEEIENDPGMTDAEKQARLKGEYGFVEGALVPALAGLDITAPTKEHAQYVIDVLPGDKDLATGRKVPGKLVNYYLIADPNKSMGAILGAVDEDNNVYLITEHLQESWPNRKHAEAFQKMEKIYGNGASVQRYADPGSAGAQSMIDFADFGLFFNAIEKGAGSVSASLKKLRNLAYVDPEHMHPITGEQGAPRIYFYRPGMLRKYKNEGIEVIACRTAEQLSQARQTSNPAAPPDTPHKDIRSKLDLFDCVRYFAALAEAYFAGEDDDDGDVTKDPNELPADDERLQEVRSEGHPLDREHFLPTYEF